MVLPGGERRIAAPGSGGQQHREEEEAASAARLRALAAPTHFLKQPLQLLRSCTRQAASRRDVHTRAKSVHTWVINGWECTQESEYTHFTERISAMCIKAGTLEQRASTHEQRSCTHKQCAHPRGC
ncbi:hypothetical protein NDU88_001245 [Pleurodeles waltl]|uniref:Uncharacterized protein n=1 Tax=Pleurodeles waltl TaxID=8319 RepID=A0AAV7P3J9_PLEWA|nr:hypothetical protein NDU88_001245 [Pleurodeles waltl]